MVGEAGRGRRWGGGWILTRSFARVTRGGAWKFLFLGRGWQVEGIEAGLS